MMLERELFFLNVEAGEGENQWTECPQMSGTFQCIISHYYSHITEGDFEELLKSLDSKGAVLKNALFRIP